MLRTRGDLLMNENPDYSRCPSCPEIKKKIDRIDRALLGEDGTGLNGGIVRAITDLQKKGKVSASWAGFAKPIAIGAVTSIVTFLITYAIAR
jgi:hypothetical protein